MCSEWPIAGGEKEDRARSEGGQAVSEFALVASVLFVLFFGIVDFGRMIVMHAAVVTASREAARYGSAVGPDDSGTTPRYIHCAGIRDAARRVTASAITLTDAAIHISYDNGAGGSTGAADCDPPPAAGPNAVDIDPLDRIVVSVTLTYEPISPARLLVSPVTIQSIDRRTIVK